MEYTIGYIYDIEGNVMEEVHGYEHQIEDYHGQKYGYDNVDFLLTYDPRFDESDGLTINSDCAVIFLNNK